MPQKVLPPPCQDKQKSLRVDGLAVQCRRGLFTVDPRGPEVVVEVAATAQPGWIIELDWEDTTRAVRYKVFKQVVGVETEPVLTLTVDDSDAQLTGVPVGSTVKLQVIATNEVGDASASPVVKLLAA